MSIQISKADWTHAQQTLAAIGSAPDPVTATMSATILNQGDVASLSGLNTTTLRSIRQGKKATKAQLAALKFAALHRLLNL